MNIIIQLRVDSEIIRKRAQATRRRAELTRQQASRFMVSVVREQQRACQIDISTKTEQSLVSYVPSGLTEFAFEALERADQAVSELLERKKAVRVER